LGPLRALLALERVVNQIYHFIGKFNLHRRPLVIAVRLTPVPKPLFGPAEPFNLTKAYHNLCDHVSTPNVSLLPNSSPPPLRLPSLLDLSFSALGWAQLLLHFICNLQFLSEAGSVPNKLSAIDPTAISTQLSSQMPSKWTVQKKKQYNFRYKSLQQQVQHLSLLVEDEQQKVAATHDAQLVGVVSQASTYCRVR
jgi:hypothetical protein